MTQRESASSGSRERATSAFDTLGAFVTLIEGPALAAAAAADADLAAGRDTGPLQGIPLAIKDIIATKDAPTTANSRVLDPSWGAGVDAPVVARLRDVGAVIVGLGYLIPLTVLGALVAMVVWFVRRRRATA